MPYPMPTKKKIDELSDERLDTMVRKASLPNLASLFKQGKAKGILNEAPAYR